jgi:hypothetical protein
MYRAEDMAQAIMGLLTNQELVVKLQENIQKEKRNWSAEKLYPELLNYFK